MVTKELYQEAYYGKLPEFEKCEVLLDAIIERARKEGTTCNPMKYPELIKIENIFCKVFGFKSTVIYFIPYDSTINAYTICLFSRMVLGEAKDFIEKRSDKGFYDNSHKSFLSIYCYTGLLMSTIGLTGKELLACMLHEVGHNFDFSGYHMFDYVLSNILTLGLNSIGVKKTSSIEHMNGYKLDYLDEVKKGSEELYNDQEQRDEVNKEIEKSLSKYYNRGKIRLMFEFLVNVVTFPIMLIQSPITQLAMVGGKMSEQFADSFATAYGYGHELVTGLGKMGTVPVKVKDNSKFSTVFRDMNQCMMEIMLACSEVHGTDQERVKNSIKKLKKDLATSDYPPELKDELKKEILKLEEYYETLLYASRDDKNKITKRWRRFCDTFFDGGFNFFKHLKSNQV